LSPRPEPSRPHPCRHFLALHTFATGTTLARVAVVQDITTRLVYDEPTVMWSMRRAGQSARAVMGRGLRGAIVVWYVNGRPVGFRDFDDWTSAIRWSDQLQAQNWAAGWRPVPDEREAPG